MDGKRILRGKHMKMPMAHLSRHRRVRKNPGHPAFWQFCG